MNVLQELEALHLRIQDLITQLSGGKPSEDVIDGVTLTEYLAAPDRATRWPGLGNKFSIAVYFKRLLPHGYVQWRQGIPYWDAGTNENWIQKYEGWRAMWQNAETEGAMPYVVNLIKEGEDAFVQAFTFMYNSPWGKAWLADDRTKGMRPKTPPE